MPCATQLKLFQHKRLQARIAIQAGVNGTSTPPLKKLQMTHLGICGFGRKAP